MDALIWIVRLFRACRPTLTVTRNTATAAFTPNTAALAVVPNRAGAHFYEEDHVTDLLTVKRGDTAPPLTLTLTDDDVPVDLTGATVRVIGVDRAGTVVIDDALTGSDVGVVVRPWAAADTATVRDLTVEAEVTWPDTTTQTFPAEGSLTVRIVPDLA